MQRTRKEASTLSLCLRQQNRALAIKAEEPHAYIIHHVTLPYHGTYDYRQRLRQQQITMLIMQHRRILASVSH